MTLIAATAITLGGVYYIHESQRTEREVWHPARLSRHCEIDRPCWRWSSVCSTLHI